MARPLLTLTRQVGRITSTFARNQLGLKLVAGLFALLLGYWGWTVQSPPQDWTGYVNNLFKTIQLLTLQFPTNIDADINGKLQAARFAVPIVAAVATFHVIIGAVTRPMRLALMPQTSGHIIVSGAERLTQAAFEALAARNHEVVVLAAKLDSARRETMEGQGLTVVEVDAMDPAAFPSVNVRKAAAVFLTHDDDLRNLDAAMLALDAMGKRPVGMPPLVLAVLIEDEQLARELDSALDDLSRRNAARFLRLSPEREGLRLELAKVAPAFLKAAPSEPSHILVIGLGGHWQQVLMQLIVSAQDHPETAPRLTLVLDEDEAEEFDAWRDAKPELALVATFDVLLRGKSGAVPADIVAAWQNTGPAPHLVLVLQDDAAAVTTVFGLRRPGNAYGLGRQPILVRRSGPDVLVARLASVGSRHVDLTRIAAFGGQLRAPTIERILNGRDDELARALHAHYLDRSSPAAQGQTDALTAWFDTPENIRDANRSAMAHTPIMLASEGLAMERAQSGAPRFDPSPDMLERFARIEHRRWMADRIDRGWRTGDARNDALRIHPSLVPYEDLSAGEQQKDRDAVQTLLTVLQGAGWQVQPIQRQES